MKISQIRVGQNTSFKKLYDHIYTEESTVMREQLENINIVKKLDEKGIDVYIVNTKDISTAEILPFGLIDYYDWYSATLEIIKRYKHEKIGVINIESNSAIGLAALANHELENFKIPK